MWSWNSENKKNHYLINIFEYLSSLCRKRSIFRAFWELKLFITVKSYFGGIRVYWYGVHHMVYCSVFNYLQYYWKGSLYDKANWTMKKSMIRARARGTDLVRLRPASASVRFLDIFPVRRPNSSLRRTIGLLPPSASVRFQNLFSVRRPKPSLRRIKRICPPSASARFEKILTVLRPNPSIGRTEGVCPPSA